MPVGTDLDRIQARLHDAGALWPRAELLRSYQDGYRELLALSHAVRRWRLMDLPGRHTYGLTHEWEDRHTTGTLRKPSRTLLAGWAQGTTLWEAEHMAGVTVSAALEGFTQEWERAYIGETDRHYRFSFPKNHERIARLSWNERVLVPVSVRELDETDDTWQARVGEPRWWTTGLGRVTSVEVYEIRTDYDQQYALEYYEAGTPRRPSGSRTYGIAAGTADNAYAYMTSGDAHALTPIRCAFVPASCYCHSWELADVWRYLPAYNFTVNFTMNGATQVSVHPWEITALGLSSDAASPGQRGMFPWERLDPNKNYESLTFTPTEPPNLGLGARITTAATVASQGFGTQLWEAEFLNGATAFTTGVIRASYTWEHQHGAAVMVLGLGEIRAVISPDRQYLGVVSDPASLAFAGALRDWRSSADSLAVLEIIVPDEDLLEPSVPGLLPPPLTKYLRYYVLARCFGRAGEGHNTVLADHYQRRFMRGVALFTRLADVAHRDRVYRREEVVPSARRVQRVGLPSEFPAVWG